MDFNTLLQKFNYEFPGELIAQEPAHPRDSARLLIYDGTAKKTTDDTFKNIVNYLPDNGVLVLNQTKVIPARLEVTKPTGGKARILYTKHDHQFVYVLSNRKLEIGSDISINKKFSFAVLRRKHQQYVLKPSFTSNKLFGILRTYGQTPLPPYIKNPTLKGKKLLDEYNTVFAKQTGSVAAPTASLHFTKSLLDKIKAKGITVEYVTLHVNLGTFASLTESQIISGKLHSERYEISATTIRNLNRAKREQRPIIAVGTTVVRTLESAANDKGILSKPSGDTTLFLTEQSKLHFVDELITNFHVPKSSLLMLVSAFTGRSRLMKIYREAINKKYRLFSFGDGMYIKNSLQINERNRDLQ